MFRLLVINQLMTSFKNAKYLQLDLIVPNRVLITWLPHRYVATMALPIPTSVYWTRPTAIRPRRKSAKLTMVLAKKLLNTTGFLRSPAIPSNLTSNPFHINPLQRATRWKGSTFLARTRSKINQINQINLSIYHAALDIPIR